MLSGVESPQGWYLSRRFVFIGLVGFAAVVPNERNLNLNWL